MRLFLKTDKQKRFKLYLMSNKPSVYHAVVVIFLEFFAFGLLTAPMITVLDKTFPKHTFLMNGLIQGVKGFLSFLSAPLIGALSDLFGRKPFLVLTVACTCSPIPLLMTGNHWWYFTTLTISGLFSVTFSVVFAYVADITQADSDRSRAYGLVSATFAASLVISPTVGAYLGSVYSDSFVVALATAIALLDVFFILACVPESLPDSVRLNATSSGPNKKIMSWDKADPFASLRHIGQDPVILLLCIVVFLSYLPEAGEYSCIFVYLRLIVGFTEHQVALYIGYVGVLSCLAQTLLLQWLMQPNNAGPRFTMMIGLLAEAIQLVVCGLAAHPLLWMIAGMVASAGSITYPAISSYVSQQASAADQGVAQGVLTGVRGLCSGLGPALFGCIFYLFQVDLSSNVAASLSHPVVLPIRSGGHPVIHSNNSKSLSLGSMHRPGAIPPSLHLLPASQTTLVPGPPFIVGSILVVMGMVVCLFLPKDDRQPNSRHKTTDSDPDLKQAGSTGSSSSALPTASQRSGKYYVPLSTHHSDEDLHNNIITSSLGGSSHNNTTGDITSCYHPTQNPSLVASSEVSIDLQPPTHKMPGPYPSHSSNLFPALSILKQNANNSSYKLSRGLKYLKLSSFTKKATS